MSECIERLADKCLENTDSVYLAVQPHFVENLNNWVETSKRQWFWYTDLWKLPTKICQYNVFETIKFVYLPYPFLTVYVAFNLSSQIICM